MQVRLAARSRVTAKAYDLTLHDCLSNGDQSTTLREVHVAGESGVCVQNVYVVLLTGPAGAIRKAFLNEEHGSTASSDHGGPDRHQKVVGILNDSSGGVGSRAAVALIDAVCLTDGPGQDVSRDGLCGVGSNALVLGRIGRTTAERNAREETNRWDANFFQGSSVFILLNAVLGEAAAWLQWLLK